MPSENYAYVHPSIYQLGWIYFRIVFMNITKNCH